MDHMARSSSRQSFLSDEYLPSSSTADDQLMLSREVQVVKQYLERSNDVNTAVASLDTLFRAASAIDGSSNFTSLKHLLETIALTLDVICAHCHTIDLAHQNILEFVNKLDLFSAVDGPDFDIGFLLKRIKSAVTFSIDYSKHIDTFGALVFDMGSILLSHCKYDVWLN
jgi:cytochrome c